MIGTRGGSDWALVALPTAIKLRRDLVALPTAIKLRRYFSESKNTIWKNMLQGIEPHLNIVVGRSFPTGKRFDSNL